MSHQRTTTITGSASSEGLQVVAAGTSRESGEGEGQRRADNCAAGAADTLEETAQPGAATLTYDAASGRYHYNWKTLKSWAGQCRTLVPGFADGPEVTAEFRFQ